MQEHLLHWFGNLILGCAHTHASQCQHKQILTRYEFKSYISRIRPRHAGLITILWFAIPVEGEAIVDKVKNLQPCDTPIKFVMYLLAMYIHVWIKHKETKFYTTLW